MHLTIAYVTARREPRFQWFLKSLKPQSKALEFYPRVLLVSPFIYEDEADQNLISGVDVVRPKPNVWNGPYRLTKDEWFAAGNARNTALCYFRDGHIAYVDDLSVVQPGWLSAVKEAMEFDGITCGAYRKVKNLKVSQDGWATFDDFPAGHDNRMRYVDDPTKPRECMGNWMYGCSLVAPVEAFLKINGWCEDLSGGIGFEDCLTGIILQNAGVKFRYDPRMMTLESEEDHHVEKPLRKSDKGVSPNDKSHAALAAAMKLSRFDNGFDLRSMRRRVLSGEGFPIPTGPINDWYDGQPLSEMK